MGGKQRLALISQDTRSAHYIPSNEDSDGDGVMDWFELYQFGNLASGPEDDSDGDGFSNKRKGSGRRQPLLNLRNRAESPADVQQF